MADRIRTEAGEADGTGPALVAVDPPEKPGPAGRPPKEDKSRRRLFIILGVITAIFIYGLAFDYTEVDLSKTSSETRQESLTRILRALARPELVTYDTEEVITGTEVAIPCGAPITAGSDGSVTVSPTCAAPGELLTISGTGYEPLDNIQVNFVPDTEFDITLPLARIQTDGRGRILDDGGGPRPRSRSIAQGIQVVSRSSIGSWGDRVEVWTDTNENGVRDNPVLGSDGGLSVLLDAAMPEAAAIALVDPSRRTVEFVSFGEPFQATTGIANGETAVRPDEVVAAASSLHIEGVTSEDGQTLVSLSGPAGFDATNWRVALYDAASGEIEEVNTVVDQIELSPGSPRRPGSRSTRSSRRCSSPWSPQPQV